MFLLNLNYYQQLLDFENTRLLTWLLTESYDLVKNPTNLQKNLDVIFQSSLSGGSWSHSQHPEVNLISAGECNNEMTDQIDVPQQIYKRNERRSNILV